VLLCAGLSWAHDLQAQGATAACFDASGGGYLTGGGDGSVFICKAPGELPRWPGFLWCPWLAKPTAQAGPEPRCLPLAAGEAHHPGPSSPGALAAAAAAPELRDQRDQPQELLAAEVHRRRQEQLLRQQYQQQRQRVEEQLQVTAGAALARLLSGWVCRLL
jgi:hypothetical protein